MGLVQDHSPPIAFGSRQGPLIALQIFFVLAALIIYCLRLYTRAYILRSTASDDHLMGVAMVRKMTPPFNRILFYQRYKGLS